MAPAIHINGQAQKAGINEVASGLWSLQRSTNFTAGRNRSKCPVNTVSVGRLLSLWTQRDRRITFDIYTLTTSCSSAAIDKTVSQPPYGTNRQITAGNTTAAIKTSLKLCPCTVASTNTPAGLQYECQI